MADIHGTSGNDNDVITRDIPICRRNKSAIQSLNKIVAERINLRGKFFPSTRRGFFLRRARAGFKAYLAKGVADNALILQGAW